MLRMSEPTPPRVPFIDAHHHLWDLDLHQYPGLVNARRPLAPYSVDDFLADAGQWSLEKSVHVQGEIERAQSVAETAWLQSIADARGFPHAIVAYAPLQDPGLSELLQAHTHHPNVRGIRQILNPDQCERPDYLTDPVWQAGYARLAQFGLSFDLQALPEQLADAAALAARHENIPVIVNHTGMPRDQSQAGFQRWRDAMRAIARQPHVSVKISGFGMFDPTWTTDSIRPLVLETIDIFGVERCMFASNFPVDKVWASYDRLLKAFHAITAELSTDERRQLFHDNARRIYRV
jgi:predicted TIM-barrel fold metal-dependent hydrolase